MQSKFATFTLLLVCSIVIISRLLNSNTLQLNLTLLDLPLFSIDSTTWFCNEPETLHAVWQNVLSTYEDTAVPYHSETIAYFLQNFYAIASTPPENPSSQEKTFALFFTSLAANCPNFPPDQRLAWAKFGIRSNSNSTVLLMKAGSAFTQLDAATEAIPVYEKLITLEPNQLQYAERLAQAYRATNNHSEAIKVLEKSLEQSSTDRVKSYILISNSYYILGNDQAAIHTLDEAEKTLGENRINAHDLAYLFYYYKGLALARSQQPDLAAVNFEKALSIRPEFIDAAIELSHVDQTSK